MTRKTIKPLTEERLYNMIGMFYKQEVERRGCVFVKTDELRKEIANIARLLTSGRCGLYVMGVVGNGKTTAMKAVRNTINSLVKNRYFYEGEVYDYDWVKMVSAFEMVSLFISNQKDGEFDSMKRRTWLILDDVGTDQSDVSIYGTTFHPFLELIDFRYENRLPTIITSNFKRSELEGIYNDERLKDRMKEMFSFTTFRNLSFRNHGK